MNYVFESFLKKIKTSFISSWFFLHIVSNLRQVFALAQMHSGCEIRWISQIPCKTSTEEMFS